MKKLIFLASLILSACLFAICDAEELTPGQIGYLTHEPWYETEVGYGWVTYPESPLNYELPYGDVYVETENEVLGEGMIHIQGKDGLIGYWLVSQQPKEVVPDETLSEYTTNELLLMIQELPQMNELELFSIDIYGKETGKILELHLEGLRWEYNIVEEVFHRDNLTDTLLAAYKGGCNANAIELLMIGDQLENGEYEISQKAQIISKTNSIVNIYKKNSGSYQATGIYDSYVQSTGRFDCNRPFPAYTLFPGRNYTVVNLLLPGGATVEAWDNRSPDWDAEDIKIAREKYENDSKYSRIVFIANPTWKYNCHSYAWYAQSTGNHYWIESPIGFKQSNGNHRLITQSQAKPGDVVYWSNGEHSAALRYSITEDLVWCTSKWGNCALYEHRSDVCPYRNVKLFFYTKE